MMTDKWELAEQTIDALVGEEYFGTLTREEQMLILTRVKDYFEGLEDTLIAKAWR